ncbi:hypothetical protein GQ42DRAFT_90014 [Ramicandelaber brevisporus]|nr:hypothetical protein GQ42DRAFT_90014 [Ramicandelaber brevisporus]
MSAKSTANTANANQSNDGSKGSGSSSNNNSSSAMAWPRELQQFVAIEFPGYVQNEDRALEMLGGIEQLSKPFYSSQKSIDNDGNSNNNSNSNSNSSSSNPAVELRFRPNDPLAPPTVGDIVQTSNIVLRVRRRKVKRGSQQTVTTLKTDVVGIANQTVRFTRLADYQIPIASVNNPVLDAVQLARQGEFGQVHTLMNQLFGFKDLATDAMDIEEDDSGGDNTTATAINPAFEQVVMPLKKFIIDLQPTPYHFRQNRNITTRSKTSASTGEQQVEHTMNIAQSEHSNIVHARDSDEHYPTEPHPSASALINISKASNSPLFQAIQESFDSCPIWRTPLLFHHLATEHGLHPSRLQFTQLAACIAYRMQGGPWAESWIRFGVDPRTSNEYRMNQQLGIRARDGIRDLINKQSTNNPALEEGLGKLFTEELIAAKSTMMAPLKCLVHPLALKLFSDGGVLVWRDRYDSTGGTGWLRPGAANVLRKLYKERITSLASGSSWSELEPEDSPPYGLTAAGELTSDVLKKLRL